MSKDMTMIRPKSNKPHDKSFIQFCRDHNFKCTLSGLRAVFIVINPKDKDSLALVSVRPEPKFKLRKRTADIFRQLLRAIKNNKLHLMRYDPITGLKPFDPNEKPPTHK